MLCVSGSVKAESVTVGLVRCAIFFWKKYHFLLDYYIKVELYTICRLPVSVVVVLDYVTRDRSDDCVRIKTTPNKPSYNANMVDPICCLGIISLLVE